MAPEEGVCIERFAESLRNEADRDLANLTGGPDLWCLVGIRGVSGCVRKACFLISVSFPSSVADSLSLMVRRVQVMSWGSILELCVGAL